MLQTIQNYDRIKDVLQGSRTAGLETLFQSKEFRGYVVVWKRSKNGRHGLGFRVLDDEELKHLFELIREIGFQRYMRIYEVDARLLATVSRGIVRPKVRLEWF